MLLIVLRLTNQTFKFDDISTPDLAARDVRHVSIDILDRGTSMHMTALMVATAGDAALLREIVNYLSGPAFPALQGIMIEVSDGVVTLRGQVKSFYTKQVLVHACRRVARVAGVNDELRVASCNCPRLRPQPFSEIVSRAE